MQHRALRSLFSQHRTRLVTLGIFAAAIAALVRCTDSSAALETAANAAAPIQFSVTPLTGATGGGPATSGARPADPLLAAPLVQPSQLSYEGAFRLPSGTFGGSSFAYASAGIAVSRAGTALYVVGHDWHQQVAEVSIPRVVRSATIDGLATAGLLQTFADVTDDRMGDVNPSDPNAKKIGGLLAYQDKLYATVYSYYDGAGTQVMSHFISGLSLDVRDDGRGPYQVGTQGAGVVSGYFALVPALWQAALGGPILNGQCCLGVVSRTSYGPALFTIDVANIGMKNPVPATALVYYPQAHPLGEWNSTNPYFNGSTEVRGVVLPQSSRTVLFFGRHGLGTFCYGPGTNDQSLAGQPADGGVDRYCFDPADGNKGTHGYPYSSYIWAYDALDLAAVKSGSRKPWDVKPYATWKLELPFAHDGRRLNGAAYDPQTNRIFISAAFGDGELPVIHVLKVQAP